jgi:nitronate monooxygenase
MDFICKVTEMWHRNRLTERLKLNWPIFQAPMGEFSTPALAAAVANSGGLGGLGMWGYSASEAERRMAGFRQMSGGSLNVNYPLWEDTGDLTGTGQAMRTHIQALFDAHGLGPVPEPIASTGEISADHLAVLQKMKPEVVSFHFGLPQDEIIQAIKAAGIFVICTATTVAEAKVLEARGVDAVIAQGTEAGGHRGTFSGVDVRVQPGLFSLLPQVVDAVEIPVIAAGGISDGRGIAAALMLGASAVQLGTAFLRCDEANVTPQHRTALGVADDRSTVLTDVSGRPARVIKNRLVVDLSREGLVPLAFPAQSDLTCPLEVTGDPEFTGLYAGQSVALGRDMPASELMALLAAATSDRLRTVSPSDTL